MKVNFKNEKGNCTREDFIKSLPKITLPEVTYDFREARERLAELKNIDFQKAAMIVAASWDTKSHKKTRCLFLWEISLSPAGELLWEGCEELLEEEETQPVLAAFRACWETRIEAQKQIVEFLGYDFGEVEE